MVRIGVVAVQGAFLEHEVALRAAFAHAGIEGEAIEVRRPSQADRCDAFVLPGGESTAIYKLLASSGLFATLQDQVRAGAPLLATCAGAILASNRGDAQVARTGTRLLELLDAEVERNAFGRQRDSFEAAIDIPALGGEPFPGVFIRAPAFGALGDGVTPFAHLGGGEIVGVEAGPVLAVTFHPELSPDPRLHAYFVEGVAKRP